MFNKMLYLLLLAVLTVPAALAENCEDFGLNLSQVSQTCAKQTNSEKKQQKKKRCTYKKNLLDCSKSFTKRSSTCRSKCDDEEKVFCWQIRLLRAFESS